MTQNQLDTYLRAPTIFLVCESAYAIPALNAIKNEMWQLIYAITQISPVRYYKLIN